VKRGALKRRMRRTSSEYWAEYRRAHPRKVFCKTSQPRPTVKLCECGAIRDKREGCARCRQLNHDLEIFIPAHKAIGTSSAPTVSPLLEAFRHAPLPKGFAP